MTRLPRAEDEVVMFIDIDGEPVRAEGTIERITLTQGFDMLRQSLALTNRRVSGTITVTLHTLVSTRELPDPASPRPAIEQPQRALTIVMPPEGGTDALPT